MIKITGNTSDRWQATSVTCNHIAVKTAFLFRVTFSGFFWFVSLNFVLYFTFTMTEGEGQGVRSRLLNIVQQLYCCTVMLLWDQNKA